ncbi:MULTISPECIES: DUF3185 family protein [unclassified Thalassotalea]|uniref:DUF3185 family protein n=1 Tax=unclassified Thalassotalea TaxID=2614972 RepID=UPI001081DB91|nr:MULTISPECIES: DUF3185 family protein [unclassified Thalassotalea]NMP16562.1 DUF3185 family protein [Thalassotalea sp. Y01]QBY03083.1 DUF3185 family protein [Thalassotalea sp. HSM 43]
MSGKLASVILMIVGVALAVWGHQQQGEFTAQVSEAVSGSPTDEVMMFYIAGGVCFVVGLVLFLKK